MPLSPSEQAQLPLCELPHPVSRLAPDLLCCSIPLRIEERARLRRAVELDPLEMDPERGMKVTLVLADAAQVADGKLNVLGGGWSLTGPQPTPFALAGIIEVPWSETNRNHSFRFDLIDLDGNPVVVDGPDGEQAIAIDGRFEVGRPPGVRSGSYQPVPFALNSGPLPLPPGGHFEWRLSIDGKTQEDWRLAFSTRPDAQSTAA
jgi:hypothetical protein